MKNYGVYINADNGKMAASGIAEFDEVCREGIIEWVQVLPSVQRQRPWEKELWMYYSIDSKASERVL